MTESEIMKALECCNANNYDDCCECPLYYEADCAFPLTVNCLDLINRKNAEIERFADIGKMYSEIKAEAIKEFIAMAVAESFSLPKEYGDLNAVIVPRLFKIAKEMGVE